MNATRGPAATEARAKESWATESLPMAVRRELLARELDRMGLRKSRGQQAGASQEAAAGLQHAPGTHPQADAPSHDGAHAD